MPHGGQILIDQLRELGCETVFCVPGESFLAALDGLHGHNDIRNIVCRQEGGATMMAEAYAKMTGQPGVCFVTRGPGASNAAIGIHIARQDSTPMILFVGQVPRAFRNREAFQEVDLAAMYAPLAKWSVEVSDTRRIPEFVARAWRTALSGRPGPVVVSLPEDVLHAESDTATVPAGPLAEAHPGAGQMAALGEALSKASRPVVLVGGPGWNAPLRDQLRDFAERFELPVVAAFRYQDHFDNRHPSYAGHAGLGIDPKLAKRLRDSDLILAIGVRLGEVTTGEYGNPSAPKPDQFLIHVHPSAEELGSVFRPDVPVQSTSAAFMVRLSELTPPDPVPWRDWTKAAHADYEAFREPVETPGAVKLERVVAHVSDVLPEDAVVASGAGNYTAFVHRYFRYKGCPTQLAPTAGAMGYCLPAALGGKLAAPERQVVSFGGDGCFMMNGQELATAVKYDLPLVMIVANNSMYGTIRMHQERLYPGRTSGTDLVNPDFAAYARSFGAGGETVERTEDFPDAFAAALEAGKPGLIELKLDPQALTPKQTLDEIRQAAAK